MRLITQKYTTSCGIACVAMLAGEKHDAVLKEAKNTFKERRFGKTSSYTNLDEIKDLLESFGISWRDDFNSIKKDKQSQERFWKELKGVNLVAVNFHIKNGTQYWHWIIAVQSKNGLEIYDPNPKKQKPISCDLTKKKLPDQRSYKNAKWYLKISHKSVK